MDQHVYIYKNRWAVKGEDRRQPDFLFNSVDAAVAYAEYVARKDHARVVFFDTTGRVDRIKDFATANEAR